MPDYRAVNYNENTPERYLNKLLSDTLMSLLYENNQDHELNKQKKAQKELEYELEKKKDNTKSTVGQCKINVIIN